MRLGVVILLCALAGACGAPAKAPSSAKTANPAAAATPAGYDPARDPAADLAAAITVAARTHKRILLEVGGEWCVWCHTLHKYFADHPNLAAYRDEHFVTVQVNFSEENENKPFLSQYPKIPGYPHFFVLEADGRLLVSQGTSELESGESYDLDRFSAFLKHWGAASL